MGVYKYDSQNDKLNRIAGGTLYADCPIGSYIPFGGTAIPIGWLLCNGQAVSRTDYADLFAVIGTAYGSGDGSTTFNIPDLREAVPKGAGLTSKSNNHLDADGLAVGEFLDDRIQNITGSLEAYSDKNFIPPTDYSGQGAILPIEERSTYGSSATSDSEIHTIGFSFDASRIVRAGATTEVKSVGSNYIIKAKQVGVPADFAPVDEVTSGNMKAVTSNAVAESFGEWETLLGSNGEIKGITTKNGKYLSFHFVGNSVTHGTSIGNLPVSFRPQSPMYVPMIADIFLNIGTNGAVIPYKDGGTFDLYGDVVARII